MSLGNALLGLLNHRPMAGYDLKKMLDHPMGFFWAAQMSQIYRELNKLEEERLVKSEIIPQEKRPDRKVYHLTKEGKETFLSWLNKFPDQLNEASRSRFLMRIFFSSKIKLDDHLTKVEQWIKDYSRENKFKEDAFYWSLIVKKEYKGIAAGIEWSDECLQLIKQKQEKSEKQ